VEHNQRSRKMHGASTITQQVAKNLFLWPGRSYVRKGLEVSFTILIEALWPKDRILETYLNIAEFGPGLYGVQSAAQKFFGKNAEELSAAEGATLVAVLPSPRVWRVVNPGPYVQARADWILHQIGERPRFAREQDQEPALPPESEPEGESAGTAAPPGDAPAPAEPPPATELKQQPP
jgi:monofunctional biosynthetic peptidoglycan transglycosylase